MAQDIPDGHVTVAEMARALRQTPAAITKRLRSGQLAGVKVARGQREVWAVEASALSNLEHQQPPVAQPAVASSRAAIGTSAEQNSVLHEVLRRRRVIDEHLATIDRCRVLIDEQRSEIEALLQGLPAIPNH